MGWTPYYDALEQISGNKRFNCEPKTTATVYYTALEQKKKKELIHRRDNSAVKVWCYTHELMDAVIYDRGLDMYKVTASIQRMNNARMFA